MPKSSDDYQVGSIKFSPNYGSTTSSPDISLLSSPHLAIFHVPIARDQKFHVRFLMGYLQRLWTKHHYTEKFPFHCTCSENPCYILELLKSLSILRDEDIRLFLQRMEHCLENTTNNSEKSTKSSGRIRRASKSQKNSGPGKTSR